MKIGFDAKRIFNNRTGLGNYGRSLLSALVQQFEDNKYILFTPKRSIKFDHENNKNVKIIEPLAVIKKTVPFLWRSFYLTRYWEDLDLDIFHGLSHELPLIPKSSRTKTLVTIHDLSFIKYPEGFAWIDRQVYYAKFKYACERSDIVIAISKSTAKDIEQMLGVDPSKIRIIGQSADELFYRGQSEEKHSKNLENLGLEGEYLVCVGLHHRRKNVKNLVRAFHKSSQRLPLILVGSHKEYGNEVAKLVEELGIQDKIKFLPSVNLSELHTLYSKAYFSVYPSLYEGFGLPVLESLLCQTPVATSSGSCLEEVGAEAALYFDPEDVDSIAKTLELLNDENKDKLLGKREAAISEFYPEKIAAKMHGLYESLLS